MFNSITSGFKKFFTKERVLAFLLLFVLLWAVYSYSGTKSIVFDSMETGKVASANSIDVSGNKLAQGSSPTPVASSPGYNLQPVANPADLLPKDQNSQWAALNPTSMNQGDVLMPDLLQAGYHIGLDTIGQSLRNANLQLRSDPLIAKSDIGPWNQSTIEPDYGRVPLEIGAQ
jgi:hypothetical protein